MDTSVEGFDYTEQYADLLLIIRLRPDKRFVFYVWHDGPDGVSMIDGWIHKSSNFKEVLVDAREVTMRYIHHWYYLNGKGTDCFRRNYDESTI